MNNERLGISYVDPVGSENVKERTRFAKIVNSFNVERGVQVATFVGGAAAIGLGSLYKNPDIAEPGCALALAAAARICIFSATRKKST